MAVSIDRAAASAQLAGHDNYGQVEPNYLPREGVFAQTPVADSIDVLEQGMFVKMDASKGTLGFEGDGAWMLVFNEEKLYDERKQMHRDFALKREDFYDGVLVPRVYHLEAGDRYTTNMVAKGSYSVGDTLIPGADGILAAGAKGDGLALQVIKETTLPDGQPAVQVMVIAE